MRVQARNHLARQSWNDVKAVVRALGIPGVFKNHPDSSMTGVQVAGEKGDNLPRDLFFHFFFFFSFLCSLQLSSPLLQKADGEMIVVVNDRSVNEEGIITLLLFPTTREEINMHLLEPNPAIPKAPTVARTPERITTQFGETRSVLKRDRPHSVINGARDLKAAKLDITPQAIQPLTVQAAREKIQKMATKDLLQLILKSPP